MLISLKRYIPLLLSLAGFAFIGCSSGPNAAPAKPLIWGGPKNISMIPIIADVKGYFRDEGLETRANYLQTGKVAMDAVVSGDLDCGVIVETNIAFVKFQQGADIKVVASLLAKHDDALVARADQAIHQPQDLEGKTIAIIPGTTSQRFADLFVDFYKIDRTKVRFLNQTNPASVQASVLNGSLPAGSVWEPYRYNLQQALGGKLVQFNDRRIYTAYGLLAVRGDYARRQPAQIEAFLRALIKAEGFIKDHQDEAIAILGKEIGIDPKVLAAIWNDYDLHVNLDASLLNVLKETGAWAQRSQQGFADKPVPSYADVLDGSFLRQVDGTRVTTK